MDSCFDLVGSRWHGVVLKLNDARMNASANRLHNDPFTISGSVLCTHTRSVKHACHITCFRNKDLVDKRVQSTESDMVNGLLCNLLALAFLRASFSLILHRANETQPGRNSCPRIRSALAVCCMFVNFLAD